MSSVHFSSKTFAQAAQIAEKIETLESQLSVLLEGGNSIAEKQSTPKTPPKRRISSPKKAAPAAPKAAEEGRGTLRPAVVAILKNSKKPLKTADIYDALVAQGIRLLLKKQKRSLEFASTKC
jgi:hypothetical protein